MDLITRKEVLDLFKVSVWTIRRWEKDRGFPKAIHLSPTIRMYEKNAVEAWLQATVANS